MKELLIETYSNIRKIHVIPVEDITSFWLPDDSKLYNYANWKDFFTYKINDILKCILDFEGFSNKEKELAEYVLMKLKEYISYGSYKTVPLHGDLNPGNIIVDNKSQFEYHISLIIDFERCRIGDPLWDFAYFWGSLDRESSTCAELFKDLLWEKQAKKNRKWLIAFRILFHGWTIKDMFSYQGHEIRHDRAKKSIAILKKVLSQSNDIYSYFE